MHITIAGSGTIGGISVGGLPDGSITNDDLAGSITDAKLSGTTCKAWVNFNGTGTVAIRASFNVSSITDNGTGNYTVNFATAMSSAIYSVTGLVSRDDNVGTQILLVAYDSLAGSVKLRGENSANANTAVDPPYANIAIFR